MTFFSLVPSSEAMKKADTKAKGKAKAGKGKKDLEIESADDLLALQDIPELRSAIKLLMQNGKKSCTVLLGAFGKPTTIKTDCLYNICVNVKKKSFWIYGGSEADGNNPSKRSHSWARTTPFVAWASCMAEMGPHFKKIEPAEGMREGKRAIHVRQPDVHRC
jgi:hypothetical protein